jgi:hypothetical protein
VELVFHRLVALAVIPLISPNLFLIEYIAITRNFDMSTQFCHIRRDFSFGADVLLLGIWVKGLITNFGSTICTLKIKAIRA